MIARRDILTAGGSLLFGAPAALGQTSPSLVAIISVGPEGTAEIGRTLRARMRELGIEEGRDVTFSLHHADQATERVQSRIREIAALRPRVLVASRPVTVRHALVHLPQTPIVAFTGDLVAMGVARSLARPGGNVTGVSFIGAELNTKRLEILVELLRPGARVMLRADSSSGFALPDLAGTAAKLGVSVFTAEARDGDDIEAALRGARAHGVDGVNVIASPVLHASRRRIMAVANEEKLPAIYQWPETVIDGGLIACGPSLRAMYRQLGTMIARILRGQTPAEIPIEQPTHFELAVNLRAAAAIDLAIPPNLLARADEVIE
jgi:putative ABC transport system substrate-binding protein